MTAPGGANGVSGDWDEARIDAAYRARFEAATPAGLADRITEELRTARRGGRSFALRPATAGFLAAAVVVVLIIGSQRGLLGIGPSGTTRPGTSTPVPATAGIGLPFPSTVGLSGTNATAPVLSVADAVSVRDGGVDQREIAVGGWFAAFAVPCPAPPEGAYGPLEDCAINFTWLMAAPEQLSEIDASGAGSIHPPAGPALNPVTDWRPANADTPQAVVFVGHFDDPNAAHCLPADRQRCADRFVVDQVAWTDEALADGFPSEVDSILVVTVPRASTVRDAGMRTELAVAGWFQPSLGARFCALELPSDVPLLEPDCNVDRQWLMSAPESLYQVSPETSGSVTQGTVSESSPVGPAVKVVFRGVRAPEAPALPKIGGSTALPVVFIGHFNDPRSTFCRPKNAVDCLRRFVVDAVGWKDGVDWVVGEGIDLRDDGPAMTPAQIAASDQFAQTHGWLLNVIVVPHPRVTLVEPAVAGQQLQPDGDPVLWMATVIEPIVGTGELIAIAYVVDTAGRTWRVDGTSVTSVDASPSP
jgi:hypothetical protein